VTSFQAATGRCGLHANEAKFLFFEKFQNLTMKLFAAALSLSPFCSSGVIYAKWRPWQNLNVRPY